MAGLVQDAQKDHGALSELVADHARVEAERDAARQETEDLRAQVPPVIAGAMEAEPAIAYAAPSDGCKGN